jgi:hypothetical protein
VQGDEAEGPLAPGSTAVADDRNRRCRRPDRRCRRPDRRLPAFGSPLPATTRMRIGPHLSWGSDEREYCLPVGSRPIGFAARSRRRLFPGTRVTRSTGRPLRFDSPGSSSHDDRPLQSLFASTPARHFRSTTHADTSAASSGVRRARSSGTRTRPEPLHFACSSGLAASRAHETSRLRARPTQVSSLISAPPSASTHTRPTTVSLHSVLRLSQSLDGLLRALTRLGLQAGFGS